MCSLLGCHATLSWIAFNKRLVAKANFSLEVMAYAD